MTSAREKVLFVGAGGAVASKLIPKLARHYDIVGIAGSRRDLDVYCIDLLQGDLSVDHERLFEEALSRHQVSAIIWNVVRYNPGDLIAAPRDALHLEFDLAIALPLVCLREAQGHGFTGSFILVTSGLAFGMKSRWGSYSIAKRGQVILAEYLAAELSSRNIYPKAVALGAIAVLPADTLADAFTHAISNADPGKILYRVYGPSWE